MKKSNEQKIKELKKLMQTDFFKDYTEQEKQETLEAFQKDLEENLK